MTNRFRKWLAISVRLFFGIGMCLFVINSVSVPQASAASTAYYIDNSAGSSCGDTNAGTSQAAPWCDFTPVNSISSGAEFQPGDSINLRAGDTWTGQEMNSVGTGTSTNWITVTSYGSGSNPAIWGTSDGDYDILVTDPDYWSFNNLTVGNAGEGILVYFTTLDHQGLRFDNIATHDIYGINGTNYDDSAAQTLALAYNLYKSAGISFASVYNYDPAKNYDTNIELSNITGTNNLDTFSDYVGGFTNVTMKGLNLQNAVQGQTSGCSDGFAIGATTNATIMDSIFNDQGACYTVRGTAAIFEGRDHNVNFVNDIMTNTPETGSPDQTAFDYEDLANATNIMNSYIGGNAGAGIELLNIHGSGSGNKNIVISGNTFVENGKDSLCQGSLCAVGTDDTSTGTIENNLYEETNGFMSTNGGSWSGFTTSNNLSDTSPANAAYDFSGTQGGNNWSYLYSTNGTSWSEFPTGDYNSSSNLWTDGSNQISQFEMFPASGYYVARRWTAPSTGTVTIDSRLLNPDGTNYGNTLVATPGEPVQARITDNGTTLWPPQGGWATIDGDNIQGVEADLEGISVNQGDLIQFEVEQASGDSNNPAADTLSWDPSMGYITAPTESASIVNDSFELPDVSGASNGFEYRPVDPINGWSFYSGSGVVTQNNATWGTPAAAPDGSQMALLQGQGYMVQTVDLAQGTYVISFDAAERTSFGGQQTFNVLVDGNNVGTFSPTSGSFNSFSTNSFTIDTGGSHSIELQGATSGDTDFIDMVQIQPTYNTITNNGTGDYLQESGTDYGSRTDLKYVITRQDDAGDVNRWTLINEGSYYLIRNLGTGDYLQESSDDFAGRTDLKYVITRQDDAGDVNRWTLTYVGSYYLIRNLGTGDYLQESGTDFAGRTDLKYAITRQDDTGDVNRWQIN